MDGKEEGGRKGREEVGKMDGRKGGGRKGRKGRGGEMNGRKGGGRKGREGGRKETAVIVRKPYTNHNHYLLSPPIMR